MDDSYYCRSSVGRLKFDPGEGTKHFDPWWCVLEVDDGIVELHRWLSKKYGKPVCKNHLWGAHVSVIKGDRPEQNSELWGYDFGALEFHYSNTIRYDNGCHAWLDVYCERLGEVRELFGLPNITSKGEHPKHYHMTLGRWTNF